MSLSALVGLDGTLRFVSDMLAHLLGYLPPDMVGLSFRQFVALNNRRNLVQEWTRLTRPGAVGGEIWVSLLTRDGDVLPVCMELTPLPGRDEVLVNYKNESPGRDQLNALTPIFTALAGTLRLSQIFDLVLEQITQVLPGEHSAIILAKHTRMRPVRAHGYDLAEFQAMTDDWLSLPNIRHVYETRRPYIVNDCRELPEWIVLKSAPSIRSWIGIPLLYNGQFCGILEVASDQPNTFTIGDASVAQLFAQQAAAAIRHAQLYRAARICAARLNTINHIGTALSHLHGDEAITVIARGVAHLMNADMFFLALYDRESNTLRMSQMRNRKVWQSAGDPFPLEGLAGYVIQQRRTLVIGDTERDGYPVTPFLAGQDDISRNVVIVPMAAGDEIFGVMSVQSYQPDHYRRSAITLLETIASQAAVAIRNAQLYAETQERLATLTALQRTSFRLATRLDTHAIIDLIAEEVLNLLNPEEVRVYTCDPRTANLSLALTRTQTGASSIFADASSEKLAQRALFSGSMLVLNKQTGALNEIPDAARPTHTLIAHPIRQSGTTFGVVTLRYTLPHTLGYDQGRTLGLLLSQAASALENARHAADVSSRLAEMSALYQVAHQVTTGQLELDTILRDVAYTLHSIFPCRSCLIALRDDDTPDIRIRAVAGLPLESVSGLRFTVGEGIFGRVVQNGQKSYIPDLYAQHEFIAFDGEMRSLLVVPLIAHDRILGALAIDSVAYAAFTPDHERILSIAASQVAAAIDNARLYQEAREQAKNLAAANHELKVLDSLRDELVQNLSHELRTPLSFVKGYVGLMREGDLGPVTDQQIDALSIIDRKSSTISRLISDIMTLETLDSASLHLSQIDLRQMALQAITGAELTQKSGVVTFDRAIPDEPLPIIGDADRLNQVLDNLIGNAIKFSPDGGCIGIRAWNGQDECCVSVRDEGIGIPPDKLPYIFERFYQVDGSARRRFGGAGLGLAIVRRIVEAHKGRVQVESQPGQGSRFFVFLPRADSPNALRMMKD